MPRSKLTLGNSFGGKSRKENYFGFYCLNSKFDQYWRISLEHFFKHKPLISEEWYYERGGGGGFIYDDEPMVYYSSIFPLIRGVRVCYIYIIWPYTTCNVHDFGCNIQTGNYPEKKPHLNN